MMKFTSKNELDQISFEEAVVLEFVPREDKVEFRFNGALIKAKNSQNGRFQDMFCGEIVLQLQEANIRRVVKEGMKYYDPDGNLIREIPNEDVPMPAQMAVFNRLVHGTVFTTVLADVEGGQGIEFGIDIPREDDEEEFDTYWLCVVYENAVASWERYSAPVEGASI